MDNESEDHGDVFRIPDLWEPSRCLKLAPDYNSFLFTKSILNDFESSLPDILGPNASESQFFSIPQLTLGPSDDASEYKKPGPQHVDVEDEGSLDDNETTELWSLPYEEPLKASNYHTWNGFQHPEYNERNNAYISEAGAQVFDAAIASSEDFLRVGNSKHFIVDERRYRDALIALALGRGSALFAWDEGSSTFKPAHEEFRISGYSGQTLLDHSRTFVECGNSTVRLRRFIEDSYRRQQSPGRIAFAEVLSSILVTMEKELSTSVVGSKSLLQMKSSFKPAHQLLLLLVNIVENILNSKDDETMLSGIFDEARKVEDRSQSLRSILLEIFRRVSRPWLEFSNQWLGLEEESGIPMSTAGKGKSFVGVENKEWINEQGEELEEADFTLDHEKIPSFLGVDDARLMFEVGRSLRLLKTHHPDHALSQNSVLALSNPPQLHFEFDWDKINDVQTKANRYERDLIAALADFSSRNKDVFRDNVESYTDTAPHLDYFGKPAEDMEAHFLASIDALNIAPKEYSTDSQLLTILQDHLRPHDYGDGGSDGLSISTPALLMVPSLSFHPIIAAQARVVNGSILRMFFRSHNLREHLSIQHQFHLLGNGIFSSRLSHALFDPDLETAERHRGVARSGGTMGLRLGGRDTWPPASSELRLALMGVLTESYTPTTAWDKTRANTYLDETSVPGDLSFAVRDMSEAEMQACRNANSLQALDFLRLSYKPPAPLGVIITPMILYKYDQIFQLLLRVLRMLYVVSALFRSIPNTARSHANSDIVAQRFRIEAQHFVASIADYFFESGIKATWRVFEDKLDQVETRIQDDKVYSLAANEGIDNLRDYHEMVLDKIMFSLLLRKRQQAVMNLLEEIFTLILQFQDYSRRRRLQDMSVITNEAEGKDLYLKFRQKVNVFVNVCRGMTEKKGYGEKGHSRPSTLGQPTLFDGSDLVDENTVPQLLLRLDMFDYYR